MFYTVIHDRKYILPNDPIWVLKYLGFKYLYILIGVCKKEAEFHKTIFTFTMCDDSDIFSFGLKKTVITTTY